MKVLQTLESYIGKGSEVKKTWRQLYIFGRGMMIKPFEEAAISLGKEK
jgi:hypothetical protein